MAGTYFGKICDKHPHLEGERNVTSRLCVECFREKKRAQKAKTRPIRTQENRDARIRYGFEVGDALIVLRNVAIECALARQENVACWIRHVRIAARIADSYRVRLAPDAKPLNPDYVASVVRAHEQYEIAQGVPRETEEPDA